MGEPAPTQTTQPESQQHALPQQPIPTPGLAYCALAQRLVQSSLRPISELAKAFPAHELCTLLDHGTAWVKQEPTLLELTVDPACRVVMVGDTHGQLHDVVKMLELVGPPSQNQIYVFNGDYVDRGAWGIELLSLLVALKLEHPTRVYLLRGNHEGSTCTKFYGFKGELDAKYRSVEAKLLYAACKRLFAQLPLAALIQGTTLILHGGLFRHVAQPAEQAGRKGAKGKRKRVSVADPLEPLEVGSLSVLRAASKGGVDPDGRGTSVVAADVLWSDPVLEPGLQENELRGVGVIFGPDVTQAFLEANGLKLILRSHEGPDARDRRDDMPPVQDGYALDHTTSAGQLMTVFSAPDYPQFMSAHETRYNNKGAVAVLSGPTWSEPQMVTYEAAPRPEATAYYDYETYPETEDELMGAELGGSQGGSASKQGPRSDAHTEEGAVTSGVSAPTGAHAAAPPSSVSEAPHTQPQAHTSTATTPPGLPGCSDAGAGSLLGPHSHSLWPHMPGGGAVPNAGPPLSGTAAAQQEEQQRLFMLLQQQLLQVLQQQQQQGPLVTQGPLQQQQQPQQQQQQPQQQQGGGITAPDGAMGDMQQQQQEQQPVQQLHFQPACAPPPAGAPGATPIGAQHDGSTATNPWQAHQGSLASHLFAAVPEEGGQG